LPQAAAKTCPWKYDDIPSMGVEQYKPCGSSPCSARKSWTRLFEDSEVFYLILWAALGKGRTFTVNKGSISHFFAFRSFSSQNSAVFLAPGDIRDIEALLATIRISARHCLSSASSQAAVPLLGLLGRPPAPSLSEGAIVRQRRHNGTLCPLKSSIGKLKGN